MRTTKTCSKCGDVQPLEEFHRNSEASDGRYSSCKSCRSIPVRLLETRMEKLIRPSEVIAVGDLRTYPDLVACNDGERLDYSHVYALCGVTGWKSERLQAFRIGKRSFVELADVRKAVKAIRQRQASEKRELEYA
jgi:hypothetical protein